MEGGAACDTLSSSFLEAYRVSFKICQLKTAERQISKVVYYFTDCHPVIAMHYTTNSFNSTRFTHGVEFKSQPRLHRCHKVMRALQSQRLNYILKGRAGGGSGRCLPHGVMSW